MGWFIDKFDPRKGTLVNILIIIITISVTLASIGASKFNWLSYLMSFMWGIADGTINIHTLQTLGFEFNSHSEPFGVFNLVQGISVFTFQNIQGQLDTDVQYQLLLYTIIVGVIGIWSQVAIYSFPFREAGDAQNTEIVIFDENNRAQFKQGLLGAISP